MCGGCANIPGVADVISSRVGISAEKGDPLGQMKLSSRAKAQAVQRDATALLTLCGLALRGASTDMPRTRNLLPWREEERKERKLAFVVAIMGATIASLVARVRRLPAA